MNSARKKSEFSRALAACNPDPKGRRWLFVPYDQLSGDMGPLSQEPPQSLGIICIETTWKPRLRRYHKQKLALIVANQRHFALEQARRGVAVRYVSSTASYGEVLQQLRGSLGPIRCMEPAERELYVNIDGQVEMLPHAGWLTTPEDFTRMGDPPWRMDTFYRHVRRKSGILMEEGKPAGGRWSFDAENRRPYRGDPPVPELLRFTPDAITREVGELIESRYADHPGTLDLGALPATAADAEATWKWARRHCLPHFGPFEDAMSSDHTTLFHTRLSPLLNIHRLLPNRVLTDVQTLRLELASLEGFVRQILGWREFMHHVHRATDGLRHLDEHNALGSKDPVPPSYWGETSGLRCLDTVVQSVWREGWSHHITRLMILSNLGMLLDINPRELTDWFWVAYIDAYDWVMDTNGMGMGLYALGGVMTTKPYVCGAAYIHRMSDYCKGCAFKPTTTCPITPMYWAFLARHAKLFARNQRMAVVMRSLDRRDAAQKKRDARVTKWVRQRLQAGKPLLPAELPD